MGCSPSCSCKMTCSNSENLSTAVSERAFVAQSHWLDCFAVASLQKQAARFELYPFVLCMLRKMHQARDRFRRVTAREFDDFLHLLRLPAGVAGLSLLKSDLIARLEAAPFIAVALNWHGGVAL